MYFLVLLFLIFGSFFAIFRFPNLMSRLRSRLRLPSFNFARGFRNPKVKTILNDRYFFYQKTEQLSYGSLFVVIGKDTAKLYQTLLDSNDGSKNKTAEEVSWSERGQTEAFAILTIQNAHYLFVHPSLMEKSSGENYNLRTRFLVDRLCQLRKKILLMVSYLQHNKNQ